MKKINFSDIKGILSRDEMKQIKGGSKGDPRCSQVACFAPDAFPSPIGNGTCGTPFENQEVCVCYNASGQFYAPSLDCVLEG